MTDYNRRDSILSCRIPLELKQGLLEYRQRNHIKTETEAVVSLLQVGLFVDSIRGQLQDPEIVSYLQDNLYNQQIVDWIFDLPSDRLEALFGAFKSARELRAIGRKV